VDPLRPELALCWCQAAGQHFVLDRLRPGPRFLKPGADLVRGEGLLLNLADASPSRCVGGSSSRLEASSCYGLSSEVSKSPDQA
jgi:hypothetical protein